MTADNASTSTDCYRPCDGIFVPPIAVAHRDDEYHSQFFEALSIMQRDHFWYRGRHRFLLQAVHRFVVGSAPRRVVDLGGGCGGWVDYLNRFRRFPISDLALADSSEIALRFAARILPPRISRYRIDLLNLQWTNRWDIAFALDVVEHILDHERALCQVRAALVPGGLLFITVPALNCFWTWNDDVARHRRRYCQADFQHLAARCGFRLREARYFMFFLSPLLLASRIATRHRVEGMTEESRRELAAKMHRAPHPLINLSLATIFSLETPLGHFLRFPWGTSLLAVLEKLDE
jgi:SAM-dependent methyltransferase